MKSTCVPKTIKISLFSSQTCYLSQKIGVVSMPDFDELPTLIVVGDNIYHQKTQSSWDSSRFHYGQVELIYVVEPDQVQKIVPEDSPTVTAAEGD